MAQDRRVIMKTSVLPTARTAYAAVPGSLEEYNITKDTYNKNTISSVGRLGGSSKMTDITSNQWGDGWSSFISEKATWDANLSNWEASDDTWDGVFEVTSSPATRLSTDSSTVKFCYIKNTGTRVVRISLDSDNTYPLQLSAGASTMFRGNSDEGGATISGVYVKGPFGVSTIEYLIAK